jgi:hypothetical protein
VVSLLLRDVYILHVIEKSIWQRLLPYQTIRVKVGSYREFFPLSPGNDFCTGLTGASTEQLFYFYMGVHRGDYPSLSKKLLRDGVRLASVACVGSRCTYKALP